MDKATGAGPTAREQEFGHENELVKSGYIASGSSRRNRQAGTTLINPGRKRLLHYPSASALKAHCERIDLFSQKQGDVSKAPMFVLRIGKTLCPRPLFTLIPAIV